MDLNIYMLLCMYISLKANLPQWLLMVHFKHFVFSLNKEKTKSGCLTNQKLGNC